MQVTFFDLASIFQLALSRADGREPEKSNGGKKQKGTMSLPKQGGDPTHSPHSISAPAAELPLPSLFSLLAG
jgi:hypothetical protein